MQSTGICRFLYNQYLNFNFKKYKEDKTIISGFSFDKYVNNELSKEYLWIKNCGSKARKNQ
jgi:putative transposase